jgi:hypothetical protein
MYQHHLFGGFFSPSSTIWPSRRAIREPGIILAYFVLTNKRLDLIKNYADSTSANLIIEMFQQSQSSAKQNLLAALKIISEPEEKSTLTLLS